MDKLTVQQELEKRKLHPVSPLIYRFLGRVVVNGVLAKKYNAHFTYVDDVSKYRGQSYVVVSNHASRMDYVFTAPAFLPDTFNFVVGYNEFFRSHLAMILRMMQVIPKKNFVHQPYAIRQIIKVIRSGGRISILPEGMSSISGANQPCALGSGHLLKSLGVPVLYTKISGGYLTAPKYNLTDRVGRVDIEAGVLFTPEQLEDMTAEEIQSQLDEKLYHDDYEWNKTARVKFDGKGRMAEAPTSLWRAAATASAAKSAATADILTSTTTSSPMRAAPCPRPRAFGSTCSVSMCAIWCVRTAIRSASTSK